MFTRQQYKAIAKILKGLRPQEPVYGPAPSRLQVVQQVRYEIHQSIAYHLTNLFAQDNPQFDEDKFLEAVNSS